MPDYMFLLESRLSHEQRAALMRVAEVAQAQETNVYLTGGAVRDLISGMPIRDLDFTVEANPSRLLRELEKHGARVLEENERLRHAEITFPGEVDSSVAAARGEVYERPGTKPETRWATLVEDLRRRDFSMNAIAISLNPASRGLLLDPTNGLSDLEKREVRALSMHAFTNQPIRLLRIVRFASRMGFKMEGRTAEWFALARERGLHESLGGAEVGKEVRQLAREDNPVGVLKAWATRDLLGGIHPRLNKRLPDYAGLGKLIRVRDAMAAAGYRKIRANTVAPPLLAPLCHYLLRSLKPRERSAAFSRMEFRSAEVEAVGDLEREAGKVVKMLMGRKTAAPREAYDFLDHVPLELLAFIQVGFSQAKALSKIRNFLYKWKPMRLSPPEAELEALGVPRGPRFDKVLDDFFQLQLLGKGRTPPERIRLLRQLAGLKPEVKPKQPKVKTRPKKEKAETKEKPGGKGKPAAAVPAESHAARKQADGATATPPPATAARAEGRKAKEGAPAQAPRLTAPARTQKPPRPSRLKRREPRGTSRARRSSKLSKRR